MPKPYSYDLRQKVIQAIQQDKLKKSEASSLFNLSRNTIDLWLKRQTEIGDILAKPNQAPGNNLSIYTHFWKLDILDKERRISERSLENLKLGAQARYQGKVRQNFTILPQTLEWLKKSGNASQRVDELVSSAKNGDLKSSYTHERKARENLNSNSAYNQINDLKVELERLKANQAQAANILQEALKLKANACGAIKEQIKQVLRLLGES